jgi:hypothetical protein|tara:strand:+ start:637 stop:801 length:165 start_codon:yes stop_codon:yes gene_type:complete
MAKDCDPCDDITVSSIHWERWLNLSATKSNKKELRPINTLASQTGGGSMFGVVA